MKTIYSLGTIALSAYLILVGITTLVGGLAIPAVAYGVLALAAGVLILFGK